MVESFKDVVPEEQFLEMVGSMKDGQFTLRKYQNILTAGQNQEVITPNSNFYLQENISSENVRRLHILLWKLTFLTLDCTRSCQQCCKHYQ
jgi:hypothetical protein